jgi:hypothetical protein
MVAHGQWRRHRINWHAFDHTDDGPERYTQE